MRALSDRSAGPLTAQVSPARPMTVRLSHRPTQAFRTDEDK